MSGLVSGYSGIIAPTNLATNGTFRINQRGLFETSGGEPAKADDYFADCWAVSSNTNVDYLTIENNAVHGDAVNLRGYGKKGQLIWLRNRANNTLSGGYMGHIPLTTSVRIGVNSNSVPIIGKSLGRYRSSDYNVIDESGVYIKQGERKQVTGIIESVLDTSISQSRVLCYLEEDGEFHITIGDFIEIAGAFKHPPKYAPVPYADDLARCQRYYQDFRLMSGGYAYRAIPVTNYYNSSISGIRAPLQKRMVANPSVSFSIYNNQVQEFTQTGRFSHTDLDTRWTITTPSIDNDVVDVQFTRNSYSSSIVAMNISMSLIAEVL